MTSSHKSIKSRKDIFATEKYNSLEQSSLSGDFNWQLSSTQFSLNKQRICYIFNRIVKNPSGKLSLKRAYLLIPLW